MKRLNNDCLFFRKTDYYIVILILILVFIFLVCSFFIKLSFTKDYLGFVSKDGDVFNAYIFLDDEELALLSNNLVVNGKFVDYSIAKISDDYFLTSNGNKRQVYLNFELDTNEKIVNKTLLLHFLTKKTIYEFIKEEVI